MVLNVQHSLTASTTLASIVSAAILTAVGLCIPYTERAAKQRGAQAASYSQQATSARPQPPVGADARSDARRDRDAASQH